MSETLSYTVRDSVGWLEIARPERHNALGAAELAQLHKLLDLVHSDDEIRVLVVTGAGEKTFCAGAALDDLNAGRMSPEQFQGAMNRIADVEIPTLARVNGNVFGGGTELALSCDFRIGVQGTRLRVPAAAFGLCYPPAGIQRFVATLGASAARRMLIASETLDADELHRIGFYDYLVPPNALDDRVDELVMHLCGLAPLATKGMKALLKEAQAGEISAESAAHWVKLCEESDDLQEGFAAQQEKRGARFVGR